MQVLECRNTGRVFVWRGLNEDPQEVMSEPAKSERVKLFILEERNILVRAEEGLNDLNGKSN